MSGTVAGAVGDFSNLASLGDLPPPASFCPCGVADSVLVFFDPSGEHPLDQDNLAVSPWIDLLAAGYTGYGGRAIHYDVYAETPIANYVFAQFAVRSYPERCPTTGLLGLGPFRRVRTALYFGDAPFCTRVDGHCRMDISCETSPGSEQIQLAVGVLNLCRFEPAGVPCTGITNTTPWFDNIALGVYGSVACALVQIKPEGRLQDAFATDGTFNPASTGRVDINQIRGGGVVKSGITLGDTLVACGDGGNTEVRIVFRVRTGPFTNGAKLAARVARWTAEPTLNARYGGAWYSSRMDTAEVGGDVHRGCWMDTFHESDPGFLGTDRALDPEDPDELANEILPDHLFPPGSRIDYFIASRYMPPDPRNPSGTVWCLDPDTTGRAFLEYEVLPSSMAADSTWSCTLWVNHHDEPCDDDFQIEFTGLESAVGSGGNNAEGVRFDRYDVERPTSFQLSFGRPLASKSGCSLLQAFMYRNLVWHSGRNSSGQFTNEDASIISPYLTIPAVGNNSFWGTGENLVRNMHETGPLAKTFLNNVCGVLYSCNSVRSPNCPAGSVLDNTFCLPTQGVPGSHFPGGVPFIHGNGCPDAASLDLLRPNPAVPTARGNLSYVKGMQVTDYASVSNLNTVTVTYHTVLDGMGVARLRTNGGVPPAGCNNPASSYFRNFFVLGWFGAPSLCDNRLAVAGLDLSEPSPEPVGTAFSLGTAYPSPMSRTVRIPFVAGTESRRLRLDVFDVSGRLVTTLFNDDARPGPHEVQWNGESVQGMPAANGLYFYRLSDDRTVQTRKLLLMR